jgi:hypothetical protein
LPADQSPKTKAAGRSNVGSAARLADLIEQGKSEFDKIHVEPGPPIEGDDKAATC